MNIIAIVNYSNFKLHMEDNGWQRQAVCDSIDLWQRNTHMVIVMIESDNSFHVFELLASYAGGRTEDMRQAYALLLAKTGKPKRRSES